MAEISPSPPPRLNGPESLPPVITPCPHLLLLHAWFVNVQGGGHMQATTATFAQRDRRC